MRLLSTEFWAKVAEIRAGLPEATWLAPVDPPAGRPLNVIEADPDTAALCLAKASHRIASEAEVEAFRARTAPLRELAIADAAVDSTWRGLHFTVTR